MEVTLETVEKNKQIYNENIRKIMEDRAELMKRVSELRRKRETLTDEIDIAELDFEESKLVQQINDLTAVFKGNKLTLEQLDLQQDILESKIDRETYSKGIVANRKAKADLSKEQELTYCENEVEKCEKALKLYTLMGDRENIDKWQKTLSEAQKSLAYAQAEVDKGKTTEERTSTSSTNEDKITENIPESQTGYSMEENDNEYVEKQQQVLKDYSGNEIGNRTITWTTDKEKGIEDIETVGTLENDDGKYSMKETTRTVGGELEQQRKEMTRDNKITGDREQTVFQRDGKGNEMYFKTTNGKLAFKITKSARGITIDNYENGQLVGSYEYDENGKAIDGMGMADMEQLDENYVENFFDSQVPYFEAENRELPTQDMSKTTESQTLLDSAIEATEESTRTSTINEQVQNIRNVQREKTQQQYKENTGIDR